MGRGRKDPLFSGCGMSDDGKVLDVGSGDISVGILNSTNSYT